MWKDKGAGVRSGRSRQPYKSTGAGLGGYIAAVEQSILDTTAVQRGRMFAIQLNLSVSVCEN